MSESPMLELLDTGNWGKYQPEFDALSHWDFYSQLIDCLHNLNRDALFVSRVHGLGHIERTMLQGAFCAMADHLTKTDTQLLLEACAYHDVGRVSDKADEAHGARSAQRIGVLTGRSGEECKILQAAVDAHSRPDAVLKETVEHYHPADLTRTLCLAELLKDADGLDRVRLGDLNPAYLRRNASRERAGLAQAVFERYQIRIGRSPAPFLSKETLAKIHAHSDPPTEKG